MFIFTAYNLFLAKSIQTSEILSQLAVLSLSYPYHWRLTRHINIVNTTGIFYILVANFYFGFNAQWLAPNRVTYLLFLYFRHNINRRYNIDNWKATYINICI
jgi:hypothetical protein